MRSSENHAEQLLEQVRVLTGNEPPGEPSPLTKAVWKVKETSAPWFYSALRKAGWVMPEDGSHPVTTDQVSEAHLRDLSEGRISAIRVPGFISAEHAQTMANRIEPDRIVWSLGGHDTDMCYGGGSIPWEVATRDADLLLEYFERAEEFEEHLREVHGDGTSMPEVLMDYLGSVWPEGVGRPSIMFQQLRSCIIRMIYPGEGANPPEEGFVHVDLGTDATREGKRLLSANIYLERPPDRREGQLCVWPVNLLASKHKLRDRPAVRYLEKLLSFDHTAQARARSLLSSPVRLEVEAGDLVIINTNRPHSVTPVTNGRRVSVQSFIDLDVDGGELQVYG